MADSISQHRPVPRWVHALAVLTVCASLPLVFLGAEVTTRQVGMVDPQGLRTPWHIFTAPLRERGLGYVIEHSHRFAGWIVGLFSIVVAVSLWVLVRQNRVRWLGWLAMFMVGAQGILGIFRVQLNALLGPNLALIHGCFAQLVLAALVAVAVVTSPAWWGPLTESDRPGLRRLALLVSLLVYAQIVFGAFVRHFHHPLAQRAHVLFAFAVTTGVVLVVRAAWGRETGRGPRRAAFVLAGLVLLQVMLGVEAWIGRFGSGVPVELQSANPALDYVRSAHFVVGAMVFATSITLTLLLWRPLARAEAVVNPTADRLAGRQLPAVQIGSAV
jgi:heme A synthase